MKQLNTDRLLRYDCISFDLFDTLVKRMLMTNDNVYMSVRHVYEKRTGVCLQGFEADRKAMEQQLWKQTAEGKFTLEDIYKGLETKYSPKVCEELKNIEIATEKINIQANEDIVLLYNRVVPQRKVIITSDMYLSKQQIASILEDLGFQKPAQIYVSGEEKANKSSGKIFDQIRQELGSQKYIHLGDSMRGDWVVPKLKGWGAIKINKVENPYFQKRTSLSLADSLAIGLSDRYALDDRDFFREFGFSVLGPLLLTFTQWIREKAEENRIEKLVFLARDGNLIKKAFDCYYEDRYDTGYMYVSRKSVFPLSAGEGNITEAIRKIKFRQKETLNTVLQRLGLASGNRPQADFCIERKDLYQGKYDEYFAPYEKEFRKRYLQQRELLKKYVEEVINQKRVAVIDVGWHGTIQDCLEKATSGKIYGFYLGLEHGVKGNKIAFLPDFDPNVIPFTRGVFETCFSASHPSTEEYKLENGCVEPVFSKCQYSGTDQNIIESIQKGALEYVQEFKKISEALSLEEMPTPSIVGEMFLEFCNNPRRQDAIRFGKVEFNDTINRKLIDYEKGKTIGNIRDFLNSDWKAGYAKVLLRANLPYGKVMAKLNGYRKK